MLKRGCKSVGIDLGTTYSALAYVDGRYDTALTDLLWAESDVTPGAPDKPLVGAVKLRYTAGDWTLSLSYPVVRPDLVLYSVTIANEATGLPELP